MVATFRVVSRAAGKREELRIWTTQTAIPMGGETWFEGIVEDDAGRVYRPTSGTTRDDRITHRLGEQERTLMPR